MINRVRVIQTVPFGSRAYGIIFDMYAGELRFVWIFSRIFE